MRNRTSHVLEQRLGLRLRGLTPVGGRDHAEDQVPTSATSLPAGLLQRVHGASACSGR